MKTEPTTPPDELGAAPCSPVSCLEHRNGRDYLRFQPHGYEFPILLPVITHGSRDAANAWTWNGSVENPTLKPSVKTTHADGKVSHIWLTDGMCQHLGDSTDGLAGQTLPLRHLANDQAQLRAPNPAASTESATGALADAPCSALDLAIRFHETYERLAPVFGYETRLDTRAFDPTSRNGKLMVAVCAEILRPNDQAQAPAGPKKTL